MQFAILLNALALASGSLLFPKEVYVKHTVMYSADGTPTETGGLCDDCCDKEQSTNGHEFSLFGKKYTSFFPCANGLISFNGEVSDFTPEPFPIDAQPMVAAFWADVDLRICRTDVNQRCSYFAFLDGNDEGLDALNDRITREYTGINDPYKATAMIIQTWDKVGFYDQTFSKTNTFQIVIVTDSRKNTFAAYYYGKMEWTTGDSSEGVDGLDGIPAQVGFDAGNGKNFLAIPTSRTPAVLEAVNGKNFLYAISQLLICQANEKVEGDKCVPRDCPGRPSLSTTEPVPGRIEFNNTAAGSCGNVEQTKGADGKLTGFVAPDTKCLIRCGPGFQPENLNKQPGPGEDADTKTGVQLQCQKGQWEALNPVQDGKFKDLPRCVEVKYNVDFSGLQLYEDQTQPGIELKVELESAPHGTAAFDIEIGCFNPTTGTTKDYNYIYEQGKFCPDHEKNGAPATFINDKNEAQGQKFTILFDNTNWEQPRQMIIKGLENTQRSKDGAQEFSINVIPRKTSVENCMPTEACHSSQPYGSLAPTRNTAKLIDNEGLQLIPVNGTETNEDGGEVQLELKADKEPDSLSQQITCKSTNFNEGKISKFKIGSEETIVTDGLFVFQLTKENFAVKRTFAVKGQFDDRVDGSQHYEVECVSTESGTGIAPVNLVNADRNTPGVLVTTGGEPPLVKGWKPYGSESCVSELNDDGTVRTDAMPDGCGRFEIREPNEESSGVNANFEVRLMTKPYGKVVVATSIRPTKGVSSSPKELIFTEENWNKNQQVTVKVERNPTLGDSRTVQLKVFVDQTLTEDTMRLNTDPSGKDTRVYGYASCLADKNEAAAGGKRRLEEEIDSTLKCFSYKQKELLTGLVTTDEYPGRSPDRGSLTMQVFAEDGTIDRSAAIAGVSAAIIAVILIIIIVVIICIVAALLATLAIRKKRLEEAERKEAMKKQADTMEDTIDFEMDEMDGEDSMRSLEAVNLKLKGERDRLAEENVRLAAAAGESPFVVSNTEQPDELVQQIKSLKGENDRLRESSSNKPGNRRVKKKNAVGFGQQQD